MKYVRQVVYFLDRNLERVMMVVLTSVLVLCLTYSAFIRYFVTIPFFTSLTHKTEELAIFSFTWLLYWGGLLGNKGKCAFPNQCAFVAPTGALAAVAIFAGRCDLAGFQRLRRMAGMDIDPIGHR